MENESVEELLDEEQEDMFEYQEVSFEESDDDQDFVDPVHNENVLLKLNDPKVTSTEESVPNDIQASRLAGEIKVEHELDDVSEALAHKPGNNGDKVKPDMDYMKTKKIYFLIQTSRKSLTTIIQNSMKIQRMNLFVLQQAVWDKKNLSLNQLPQLLLQSLQHLESLKMKWSATMLRKYQVKIM